MQVDALIVGGGVAGLWTGCRLRRAGLRVLLVESQSLGRGQTIAAQGIIHGGLKYSLSGLVSPAARMISEMPEVWRDALSGRGPMDLSRVRLRSPCCYLWNTQNWMSRAAMWGARLALKVTPQVLAESERPAILTRCKGTVARLDEPVIDTGSLLEVLGEGLRENLVQVARGCGIEMGTRGPGQVKTVRLRATADGPELEINPKWVILAAGAGNADLRALAGLGKEEMQRRPLHMAVVRGELPEFYGHCVDGSATRVTITTQENGNGTRVWQLGGQVAERGVDMNAGELIRHAASELGAVLPELDLRGTHWSTYRVDRAERLTSEGRRPDEPQTIVEGNCITTWPTKLALAPVLSETILKIVGSRSSGGVPMDIPANWPRPSVAKFPWEAAEWVTLPELSAAA